jgi:hypothetical protein
MQIQWISEEDEVRRMEGAYIDSTPLFLPTYWNYSFPLPSPVHQRHFPAVAGLFAPEFFIHKPQAWEEVSPVPSDYYHKKISTPDLLSRQSFDYSAFWKIRDLPESRVALSASSTLLPIRIQSFPNQQILLSDLFAVPSEEDFSESLLRPLEFRVLVTPEGLFSPTLIDSYTGHASKDEWLRLRIQEHPFWKNARPGYYQVSVGLL